ncbi:PREDICTED: vacuolar ATPase assembly integral membrane protein VMA21 [Tinamus guttatus]|uniref:vacuolar ATPase assembly integral membrane protein VMA21 n=1 Tax=Tinamus guttatus TaxID=94827 RepID=UPI00052EA40F|nr:PREDICTED: vacuolar ATPase assembly integral membrane protein VMA21 [Tinamus guttatus]
MPRLCRGLSLLAGASVRNICCDIFLHVTFLVYFRNEGSLTSTLRTLLFFTALMITLPVGLYFSSKAYIFEGTLGMSNRDSYFYAAIVAVVTVHVVLALFVYVAWNEGTRQWREGKQD